MLFSFENVKFTEIYSLFFQVFGFLIPLVIAIHIFGLQYIQNLTQKNLYRLDHYFSFDQDLIDDVKRSLAGRKLYQQKEIILKKHSEKVESRRQDSSKGKDGGLTDFGVKHIKENAKLELEELIVIENHLVNVQRYTNYLFFLCFIIAFSSLTLNILFHFSMLTNSSFHTYCIAFLWFNTFLAFIVLYGFLRTIK